MNNENGKVVDIKHDFNTNSKPDSKPDSNTNSKPGVGNFGTGTPSIPNYGDMAIFIGTPAYNSMVHTDYLHTIIEFHKNQLPITVMTLGNESLIPRGRNTVISYFHMMKDFTHLLFLDADMFLPFDGFMKLMSHKKDVIGAPVALKGFGPDGQPIYNTGKVLSEEKNDLICVDRVGTAVMILSRNAVNALVKDAKDNNQVYDPNPYSRGDSVQQMDHFNIFQTGVVDREYDSEDYYICRKLKNLGFSTYVDPTVRCKHNGMYQFV